jgi:Helix-turn-helix domain
MDGFVGHGCYVADVLIGRRFRAELTDTQASLAQQTADACRAVWNTGLEQTREELHPIGTTPWGQR